MPSHATRCCTSGLLEEALLDYSAVLRHDPSHAEAAYQRGAVCHKLGSLEQAIADFSLVLRLEPSHVKAAYSRAACNNLAGRFDAANGGCCLAAGPAVLPCCFQAAGRRCCTFTVLSTVHRLGTQQELHTDRVCRCAGAPLATPLFLLPPSRPPLAADYEQALAVDASLPDRRWQRPPASTPGMRSLGSLGSMRGSPATSTCSLPPDAAGGAGTPAGTHGEAKLHGRKASLGEAAHAVSHFSIAAVLKPGKTQAGGAQLAAAASLPAKQQVTIAAAGGAAAGGQRQQQQQVSLSVDARQRVSQPPQRLPGGADVAAATGLPAVRLRAPSASPQDAGCSSVPLEVEAGSPLRGAGGSAVLAQQQQQQQAGQLTAEEHHALGYALRKRGDFEGAVRAYSAALALQPAHFKCLFNRAFSLDKVGQVVELGVKGGLTGRFMPGWASCV